MTLESLRAFCAVIETGSFHAAAARIHRSQPAVSQQIRRLETELGHSLIERASGQATPAGHVLYGRASRLLHQAENMRRELADFDESRHRPLRIGASDTTALYYLPNVVRKFSAQMPQTRLEMVNRPSESIGQLVTQGSLDLGIVTLPMEVPGLEAADLFSQRLVLIAPRRHKLAGRRRVTLDALANESFLQLDPGTRTGGLLHNHFIKAGFEPAVVLDSGSFEVIKRYVAEGVGVAIVPEMAVRGGDAGLAVLSVPGLPRICAGAVWRSGAYRSPAELAFTRLLGLRG